MSENTEFAKRIIKMRIQYVLEKSQSRILDENKLGDIALKLKNGKSQRDVSGEIQKLALNGSEKARPLLKEVIKQLLDEYSQTIKDITDEAIIEMVNYEINKHQGITMKKPNANPENENG
jgi:hypothetical protein